VRPGKLALLVIPVAGLVLGGCAQATTAQGTVTAAPSSTAPWLMTNGGTPLPVPTPTISYLSPAPFPSGFLPLGSVSPSPTPAASGDGCSNIRFHPGQINSATVVAGTTSATVSWWNPGGSDLVEYRLTAIPEHQLAVGNQRDVGWTVIKPGSGCGMMSAPVTGLDRKTSYVFSVDAVFTKTGVDGTWASTIARSIPTTTS
jgi:hypothetical protein